jgi:regulator of sirC expression with transglutaminase-like and TPR domain
MSIGAGFRLPDWNALAGLDDDGLPLLGTALLIARDEYPDLEADAYDALVQRYADELRDIVEATEPWPLKMRAINQHLFDEIGFSGNQDEYYDPRNSYLNQVFERRLGNPISLAMVQMEVARRLGMPLDGISFPGHFLVRLPVGDSVLVMDPFNRGRPLDVEELRQRAKPHLGGEMPDDEALFRILHPATHRAMLMRMLRNLHGVYAERDDWERAVRSADRLLKLAPDNAEALRDRGLGYLKLGYRHGARQDLDHYLQRNPDASDAGPLRERLVELSASVARPN